MIFKSTKTLFIRINTLLNNSCQQDEIEPLVREDDGIFWMSYSDMLKYFSGINVCMVRGFPDSNNHIATAPWKEARRRFHFDFG